MLVILQALGGAAVGHPVGMVCMCQQEAGGICLLVCCACAVLQPQCAFRHTHTHVFAC